MMNSTQIRFTNFLALFKEFRDANPELPDRGMLKLFAEKLELSDRYLSHVKNGRKPIGSNTARHIEAKTGKPSGWMDVPHQGNVAINENEQWFMDSAMLLYRQNPDWARQWVLEALQHHMSAKTPKQ